MRSWSESLCYSPKVSLWIYERPEPNAQMTIYEIVMLICGMQSTYFVHNFPKPPFLLADSSQIQLISWLGRCGSLLFAMCFVWVRPGKPSYWYVCTFRGGKEYPLLHHPLCENSSCLELISLYRLYTPLLNVEVIFAINLQGNFRAGPGCCLLQDSQLRVSSSKKRVREPPLRWFPSHRMFLYKQGGLFHRSAPPILSWKWLDRNIVELIGRNNKMGPVCQRVNFQKREVIRSPKRWRVARSTSSLRISFTAAYFLQAAVNWANSWHQEMRSECICYITKLGLVVSSA